MKYQEGDRRIGDKVCRAEQDPALRAQGFVNEFGMVLRTERMPSSAEQICTVAIYGNLMPVEGDPLPQTPIVVRYLASSLTYGWGGVPSKKQPPKPTLKDVHTQHCCVKHGCKYGDEDCTVVSGLGVAEPNACYTCFEEDSGW